jgi:hypothetical protein
MDNLVSVLGRSCADAALSQCSEPERYQVHRHIELRLQKSGFSKRILYKKSCVRPYAYHEFGQYFGGISKTQRP